MTNDRNIYCYVEPGGRPHVLDASCWCNPEVTSYARSFRGQDGEVGVIIFHSGDVRPAVTSSIHRDLGVSSLFDREKIRSAPGAANSDAS